MNFRMPAEWEKQAAIWLAFPHEKSDFPGKFETIKWVYIEIIKNLVKSMRVRLIVQNEKAEKIAKEALLISNVDLTKIDFIIAKTNRSWLRDSAPTFVYEGKNRLLLDWKFNAWAKYDNWQSDNKLINSVAEFTKLPAITPVHKGSQIVMEGGAIEVNGAGSMLATRECLLSDIQCRNPGFSQKDYEEIFAKYLGCEDVIWLENGILGDDTHGHIDDLARFVDKSTIVTVIETNKKDGNYDLLQKNLKILKKTNFEIVPLPMPKPIIFDNYILPASYANFLIANDIVLVPIFNDANDRVALDIIAKLFPKHEVIGIYSGDFVLGLGTIHCASQQEIISLH
ncbi:MAG: agmatine deiminase family protein [Pseudomonadota bacterium]